MSQPIRYTNFLSNYSTFKKRRKIEKKDNFNQQSMENLILPCKSRPPILIPSKLELPADFSTKTVRSTLSFTKTHQQSHSKAIDSHLTYLCEKGRLSEAITTLDAIALRGSKVRPNTYAQLLQSCIDSNCIQLGRKIHARIDLLHEVDTFVETKLVSMYAKCGCLEDARKVFDEMRVKNLYTWSAMIGACCREQRWREVVGLFFLMMEDGIVPDDFLFPKILQACGNCGDFETGKLIHSIAIRSGLNSHTRVSNSVLAMYAKCRRFSCMHKFFQNMDVRDSVAWNSMITGHCQRGEIEKAHELFDAMREEGIEPGLVTWNILIASYSRSGDCDVAVELMKKMESYGITPDVFTWSSMISGFARNNRRNQALELFIEMLLAGVVPSGVTITSAISACASLKGLTKGKELHSVVVKMEFIKDVLVTNSLIDMYSKCGELEDARRVFDMVSEKDVYTWNSMIGGYCQAAYCGKAYDLFMQMQESNVQPNVVTWNVMISGYIQNGDEDQAMDLFQKMEKHGITRNTASWNSLIAGNLQNGHKNKALWIFRQMQLFDVMLNSVTILSVLPACANLVATKKVKEIHGCVLRRNLESELSVVNSLIDTYAKSGNILYSRTLFDGMSSKDIITWNSVIGGHVLHGGSDSALDLYDQMRKVGLKPNRSTFLNIISAYGLAGMVEEGKHAFSTMAEDYQILPCLEHYLAMVDLFGRAGKFGEAIEFIEDIAIEPNSSIWAALLTASRVHGNNGLAVRAGEQLLELDPGNLLNCQLLLQAYALCGISKDAYKVKIPEKGYEFKRPLGQSWIEVKNTVHTFVAGDMSNPYSDIVRSWIQRIAEKVMQPSSQDLCCIEEEEKEEICGVHSEKLAIAFALISSPCPPRSIRIVKNVRMCRDCHRTAKFISMTYRCEIYLKDSKCFHHFKDGHCSCGDYW